mmetsp:Transcript_5264/g.12531  ORF Transcript_5264/g.12531 Transcript_5264/m.12531 type:complete len:280 (+) Transcript_5264:1011-1850(+)
MRCRRRRTPGERRRRSRSAAPRSSWTRWSTRRSGSRGCSGKWSPSSPRRSPRTPPPRTSTPGRSPSPRRQPRRCSPPGTSGASCTCGRISTPWSGSTPTCSPRVCRGCKRRTSSLASTGPGRWWWRGFGARRRSRRRPCWGWGCRGARRRCCDVEQVNSAPSASGSSCQRTPTRRRFRHPTKKGCYRSWFRRSPCARPRRTPGRAGLRTTRTTDATRSFPRSTTRPTRTPTCNPGLCGGSGRADPWFFRPGVGLLVADGGARRSLWRKRAWGRSGLQPA